MTFNRHSYENGDTLFTQNDEIAPTGDFGVEYANGVDVKTFRGTTDTDITGWVMRNASGTAVYVYPNAGGNGLTASTTRP